MVDFENMLSNEQQISNSTPHFAVNASRVGSKGGLHTFTIALLSCLSIRYPNVEVVVPEGVPVPVKVRVVNIPSWLRNSSRISKLRPLLWLLYSSLCFPVKSTTKVISTTHHLIPFRRSQIPTVHDLRPFYEPDSWVQQFYFRHLLPRGLRKCDGIITVSQTSKFELIRVYGVPAERVYVIPNAVSLPIERSLSRTYNAQDSAPYLLMVGASLRHKNAIELLERHALWEAEYKLKIIAGKGQYRGFLEHRTLMLGIGDRVEFIDEINEERLAEMYSTCSALVYPSRMEGFGLPPLEAMSYGRPAIVSDIPVLRELLGDAALFVKLGDEQSWATAFRDLKEVTADHGHWRIDAGRKLAASFSLERMETALMTALREIWSI